MTKTCNRCQESKPADQFYYDKRIKTSIKSTCKRCIKKSYFRNKGIKGLQMHIDHQMDQLKMAQEVLRELRAEARQPKTKEAPKPVQILTKKKKRKPAFNGPVEMAPRPKQVIPETCTATNVNYSPF